MPELRERIAVQKPDIIAVVETWAYPEIRDAELALEGFIMYQVDRRQQHGGGVILFVRDTLVSKSVDMLNSDNYEDCVWCTVNTCNIKLLIGVCYRSPASTEENNAKLLKLLDRAVNSRWGNRVMILGDFNFRDIDYNRHLVNTGSNTDASNFFSEIAGSLSNPECH